MVTKGLKSMILVSIKSLYQDCHFCRKEGEAAIEEGPGKHKKALFGKRDISSMKTIVMTKMTKAKVKVERIWTGSTGRKMMTNTIRRRVEPRRGWPLRS